MRSIIIIFLVLQISSISARAQSTQWGYDASHAKVAFTVSHFGISETEGRFTKFDGSVAADKPDFSDAQINFTIDVSSIDTDDGQRDTHLKSADFFDAAKFPVIVFRGTKLSPVSKNKYRLTGTLTMHGVTKEIGLDVNYRGTVVDPFKNTKAGFRISGAIDRTEFGLNWNGKLASGEILVGNQVNLDINIELVKKS